MMQRFVFIFKANLLMLGQGNNSVISHIACSWNHNQGCKIRFFFFQSVQMTDNFIEKEIALGML